MDSTLRSKIAIGFSITATLMSLVGIYQAHQANKVSEEMLALEKGRRKQEIVPKLDGQFWIDSTNISATNTIMFHVFNRTASPITIQSLDFQDYLMPHEYKKVGSLTHHKFELFTLPGSPRDFPQVLGYNNKITLLVELDEKSYQDKTGDYDTLLDAMRRLNCKVLFTDEQGNLYSCILSHHPHRFYNFFGCNPYEVR